MKITNLIWAMLTVWPFSIQAQGNTIDHTREDVALAARACVHESTWAGGEGGTFDCGGQIQVIQNRRARGESFRSALARTMPRFARGAPGRSWVLALPDRDIRGNPAVWPFPYSFHARSDEDGRSAAERWRSVYVRVARFMNGREPLPCQGQPLRWFGRRTDRDQLAALLSTGRWRECVCGETRNAFLERALTTRDDELGG